MEIQTHLGAAAILCPEAARLNQRDEWALYALVYAGSTWSLRRLRQLEQAIAAGGASPARLPELLGTAPELLRTSAVREDPTDVAGVAFAGLLHFTDHGSWTATAAFADGIIGRVAWEPGAAPEWRTDQSPATRDAYGPALAGVCTNLIGQSTPEGRV